jgi:type IV secretion system protein VirB4
MLRALQDQMSFGAVSRRERPVSSHLPYLRHVDDFIVKSKSGLLMNFIKLEGFSFQTADWSSINVRMLGRNDLVRTVGNSRFALYSHIIRREIEPTIPSSFDNAFCRELDEHYHTVLSKRRMFVNDLYLTIIRRPLQGHAGTFEALMQTVLGKKTGDGDSFDRQEAQAELRDITTAVLSAMSAYRPRLLKVVERAGVWFSEPLEFLVQLGNGAIPRPMHLPRMSLDQALATKRVFFGKNALEIRGGSASESRFGAVLSVREYPGRLGPVFSTIS